MLKITADTDPTIKFVPKLIFTKVFTSVLPSEGAPWVCSLPATHIFPCSPHSAQARRQKLFWECEVELQESPHAIVASQSQSNYGMADGAVKGYFWVGNPGEGIVDDRDAVSCSRSVLSRCHRCLSVKGCRSHATIHACHQKVKVSFTWRVVEHSDFVWRAAVQR